MPDFYGNAVDIDDVGGFGSEGGKTLLLANSWYAHAPLSGYEVLALEFFHGAFRGCSGGNRSSCVCTCAFLSGSRQRLLNTFLPAAGWL